MNQAQHETQSRPAAIERVALVGVTLLGMAMCTQGVGKIANTGQWASIPGMIGVLLGLAALSVVGARLLGKAIPFAPTDRMAIAAMIAILMTKVAVATAFGLNS